MKAFLLRLFHYGVPVWACRVTPALRPLPRCAWPVGPLALLAVLAVSACSGPAATPSEPGASAEEPYVRAVAPFEVRAEDGQPYAFPFLGGFNVPRPQFVDIDGDGDIDLFMQEQTNRVMFFENVGTATAHRFVWRTDRFAGLDVGEWYRFVDADDDGDLDLMTEQPFSRVRYYRNDGGATAHRFTLAADTLRDADGAILFADRQSIPHFTDLDCDGELDLFIGKLDGTVSRYERVGFDAQRRPLFRMLTERFEDIEIVAEMGTMRHGANSLTFSDVDLDGDFDLFWGDFFEAGLLFIENTGTCERPALRAEPEPFPPADPFQTSGYNAPAFTDLDGDDDLDLFVGVIGGAYNPTRTGAENFYYFERAGEDFTLRTRRFLDGIDVGGESTVALADLDTDGDLDLFVSNKIDPETTRSATMTMFLNTGSATAPAFQAAGAVALEEGFHYAPAFADLDADGDLDLLLGTWNDGVLLYRNDGTPTAPNLVLAAPRYLKLTRGSHTTPALADLDADGDLDLLIGESSGTLNYYRNDGTRALPEFVLVSDEYLGVDVGQRSAPAFHDHDGDGDFDLFIGRESGGFVFFENRGTPAAARFVEAAPPFRPGLPSLATPTFADIDGDGDADLFTGSISGGVMLFRKE